MTPSERKKRVDAVVKAANEYAEEAGGRVRLRPDALRAFKAGCSSGFMAGYRKRMRETKEGR